MFWLELGIQVIPDRHAGTALVRLRVDLATEGTKQRTTKTSRTWLVSSPQGCDVDAPDAWAVAMLGQVYASAMDRYQSGKPVTYPNTSSRT